MNLVTTIASFITPMIANRIAGALGVSPGLVTTAIGAIIPTLLAGMAGKASTPAGAGALFDVLGKQDPGLLGSFADTIGGAGQKALIDSGSSMLGSLLGGSATGALASAVGKFAGASPEQATGLIGMLAPVVLGGLGQQAKSSGLDSGGLAKLLDGQKSNIAAAMPAGFSDLLAGSGLLDSVKANLAPPPQMAPRPMPMPSAPARPEPGFNWMPWALGAAALLALFYIFGGGAPKVTPPAVEKAAAPSASANAAAEASEKARQIFSGLTGTLSAVKDEATAKAALPKLTDSVTAIDALSKLQGTLGGDAKATLAKLVAGSLPQLTPLIATVLKIPGAEAVLKPVLDQVVAKLTAMSK